MRRPSDTGRMWGRCRPMSRQRTTTTLAIAMTALLVGSGCGSIAEPVAASGFPFAADVVGSRVRLNVAARTLREGSLGFCVIGSWVDDRPTCDAFIPATLDASDPGEPMVPGPPQLVTLTGTVTNEGLVAVHVDGSYPADESIAPQLVSTDVACRRSSNDDFDDAAWFARTWSVSDRVVALIATDDLATRMCAIDPDGSARIVAYGGVVGSAAP